MAAHETIVDRSSETSEPSVRLVFSGDCIIPEELSTPFVGENIQARISTADRAIVNLEAPIIETGSPIAKSGPVKVSAPDTAPTLVGAGFDIATLANNHAMDYGEEGLNETLQSCAQAGLDTVGAGSSARAATEPVLIKNKGISIAVLNLCEREFGIATGEKAGTAWVGQPDLASTIKEVTETWDVVIAIIHGGIEYVPFPPREVQRRHRNLIEQGIDLVVGHHPHVAQGWEQFQDGLIVYSLGNFFFNQSRPETQWGLLLDTTIQKDGVSTAEIIPIVAEDGMVSEMSRPERQRYLRHLHRLSAITADRQSLEAHWQAQAVHVFHRRYTEWLTKGVGALPRQFLSHPSHPVDLPARWTESADQLVLLNLIRNESHRAVIQTALEVQTGVVPDQRTANVEQSFLEQLQWTDPPTDSERGLIRRGIRRLLQNV